MRRNKKQTINTSRFDWYSHNNCDIRNQYTVTVRNNYDTPQGTSERHASNDVLEIFVTTHIEAGIKPRAKYRVPWESKAARKKTR